MDERIIIRHLNLGKANQAEEFPLKHFKEVTIGRDTTCEVKYDPDRDDLVSRKHAKITVDQNEPLEFSIVDLGSRNGTFVNKQRIFSSVKLAPGDVVQFGAGGPEFQFDVEPRPVGLRPTRLGMEGGAANPIIGPPPTREGSLAAMGAIGAMGSMTGAGAAPPPLAPPPPGPPATAHTPIGKATVERMITQNKTQTRNNMLIGGLILFVLLAAVAAYVFTRKPTAVTNVLSNKQEPGRPNAAKIAQDATDSVVFFEIGWKLFDTENGRQLSHVYLPNAQKNKEGKYEQIVNGAGSYLPVFLTMDGKLEPILSTEDGDGKYQPIGERGSGSGFVVSSDGFILTNRHVAAGWNTRYSWNPNDRAGLILGIAQTKEGEQGFAIKGAVNASQFPAWVPAGAQVVVYGALDLANAKQVHRFPSGKAIEGRNDYLDVTFAKNRIRVPAKLARVSDHVDVAMVKIDLPRSLKKLEMNDNYDTIKPGDEAIVMGYPALSPQVIAVTGSQDFLNRGQEQKVVPDPTVTVGNIGRVLRSGELSGSGEGLVSSIGDVYQINVSNTGPGNSGGPVFDDQGRVIGIFTAGGVSSLGIVTFGVPIRYGMELMGVTRVSK